MIVQHSCSLLFQGLSMIVSLVSILNFKKGPPDFQIAKLDYYLHFDKYYSLLIVHFNQNYNYFYSILLLLNLHSVFHSE
jgi:hypothetical protein